MTFPHPHLNLLLIIIQDARECDFGAGYSGICTIVF